MSLIKTRARGINLADTFDFSAGLTLGDNLTFDVADKGVHLGVTTATAANLLDDYEEGTWTPVGGTASGFTSGITSHSNSTYSKIGNIVQVRTHIQMGNSSGNVALEDNVTITGLPFTAANTENSLVNAYRYNSNNALFAIYLSTTSNLFVRCQQVNGSAPRNGGSIAINYIYKAA